MKTKIKNAKQFKLTFDEAEAKQLRRILQYSQVVETPEDKTFRVKLMEFLDDSPKFAAQLSREV